MPNKKFYKGVEVVGSAIIENLGGKILLTRSPKWSNKWTTSGGHIDPGETILILSLFFDKVGVFKKSINQKIK